MNSLETVFDCARTVPDWDLQRMRGTILVLDKKRREMSKEQDEEFRRLVERYHKLIHVHVFGN